MGLNWEWSKKCGEVVLKWNNGEWRECVNALYQGNAYLIELNEYTEDGEDAYSLQSFMADEAHAKRMFGLDKKYGYTYGRNCYESENRYWSTITLYKDMWDKKKLAKFVGMLTEAFKNIEIIIKERA